jgi:hypothetical protein
LPCYCQRGGKACHRAAIADSPFGANATQFPGISGYDGWARIKENTLKRNQFIGMETVAADGAADFSTGTSVNDVLDVRIERNTVKNQTGGGILIAGGVRSPDGRARAGVFGPLAEDGGRGVKP